MVATDGHRLSMVESSGDVPGVTAAYRALLPRKAMLELQKFASDADPAAIVQFSGDENHLFFKLGDRLLLSRKLTGNFPDFAARRIPRGHRTCGPVLRRTVARDSRARG
jgi:DNA polymerase-3 subunit beta